MNRLRPYKRRPLHLGPSEEDVQPEALAVDPRGGTWWEVEDVVAHQRRCGRRRFLVQYKGFSPAYDEWKSEQDVSPQLIEEYDELWRLALTGVGTRDGDGEFPRSPGGEVEGGHQGRALPTRPITEAGPRCASGTPAEMTVTVLGGVLVTNSNIRFSARYKIEP